MTLIQKIKSYFLKYEFNSREDFKSEDYPIKFRLLDDEILVEIGIYLKCNLLPSEEIGNTRHRLKDFHGIECENLDQLLPLLSDIITTDHSETLLESIEYNWDYEYIIGAHSLCVNIICISNVIRNKGGDAKCIYLVASIRKFRDKYYCWNHVGSK